MTNDFPPKIRGFSTYTCKACDYSDFKTYCILCVPEFEGYSSSLPSACPYKMTFETKWERVKD